jgi:predicted permease
VIGREVSVAIWGDRIKQVIRRLAKTPLFSLITLLTLAVAVGANTAIFSVVEGVLLKPLPYSHPEQLIGVWHTAPGIGMLNLNMSPFIYFIDREQSTTLEDIGVYDGDSVTVTGAGEPEHVRGLDVSSGTLPILGVTPEMGRLFTARDDSPGAPETIVLSHEYWQKKFGGNPKALGTVVTVDGRPREVIGILPKSFQFMDYETPAFLMPFQWDRSKTKLGNFSFQAVARLKPGVTMAQASADMKRLLPIAIRSFPAPEGFSAKVFESVGLAPNLRPLKTDVIGDIGSVLWVLMGSIATVLLIACANVANLLLVRVEGRRQELAIRSALGAGWKRIAVDLMLESIVLSVMGSLLGLGLAYAGLQMLVAAAPAGLPRIHEIGIDPMVLLFALCLMIVTSLLIGAIPVLKFAGGQLNGNLREGGRGQSQSREQHRVRNILVVLQVALALILLICSGLMIRTFHALAHVETGFSDAGSLQTFRLSIPDSQAKSSDQVLQMEQAIQGKIAAIPGVNSVAMTSTVPMEGRDSNDAVFAQDHVYSEGQLPPIRRFKFVSPEYLGTAGTSLVAGRAFTWSETLHAVPVAVVSENFAREMWHTPQAALGKRIRAASTDDWREVVGVARDVYDDGVDKPAPASIYWPLKVAKFEGDEVNVRRDVAMVIRSQRAGSQSFMREVQAAVWSTNANLPLADVHTLDYYYRRSMARTSFTLVMLSMAGAMALLLGVVGIYGVISYSVSQRTREIGIRMALGAQRQAITAMFVKHGLLLAGIGITFGLAGAAGAMRLMASLLFQVSPVDPATYGVMTLTIVLVACIACYLPSRRAASVEPVHALRAD